MARQDEICLAVDVSWLYDPSAHHSEALYRSVRGKT